MATAAALSRLTGLSETQRALLRDKLRARPDGPSRLPRDGSTFPLSATQQRFWYAQRIDPRDTSHNVPLICRLTGPVDAAALTKAFADLVARHEILRTRFVEVDGSGRQLVVPLGPSPLVEVDLSDAGEQLDELVDALCGHAFDLAAGPALLVRLLRLDPAEHVLVILLHHIVFDGWSQRILLAELSELYAAWRAGRTPTLSTVPVQFGDFAAWERDRPRTGALDYWRDRLAGLAELELPTDRPRTPVLGRAADQVVYRLGDELTAALHEYCRRAGVSLFLATLTAFVALLHRLAGQDDFAVGSVVSGRTSPATRELIGPLLNIVVLRADVSDSPTFHELTERMRRVVLDALDHQEVPFDSVVDAVLPVRDPGRHPLFQVLFQEGGATTENLRVLDLPGTRVTPVGSEKSTMELDLSVGIDAGPGGVRVVVDFRTELFDRDTVESTLDRLALFIEAMTHRPDGRIAEVDLPRPGTPGQP